MMVIVTFQSENQTDLLCEDVFLSSRPVSITPAHHHHHLHLRCHSARPSAARRRGVSADRPSCCVQGVRGQMGTFFQRLAQILKSRWGRGRLRGRTEGDTWDEVTYWGQDEESAVRKHQDRIRAGRLQAGWLENLKWPLHMSYINSISFKHLA